MSPAPFKTPKLPPTRHSHLTRLVQSYAREQDLPQERVRHLISSLALIGVLQRVERSPKPGEADPGTLFLVKGGVAMELRFGMQTRTTNDFDVVFKAKAADLQDALDDAFAEPFMGFRFTRHGEADEIRETGTRRQLVKISFQGRGWQTLTMEIAQPEGRHGAEPEMVGAVVSIEQFGLPSPKRVAVMAIRYQIAQKLHAVTEQPSERENERYWDLIDLLLLRDLVEDVRPIREACVEVFENRKSHRWPPALVVPASWHRPYAADAATLAFTPGVVEEAATEVRAMIAEIDAAR